MHLLCGGALLGSTPVPVELFGRGGQSMSMPWPAVSAGDLWAHAGSQVNARERPDHPEPFLRWLGWR